MAYAGFFAFTHLLSPTVLFLHSSPIVQVRLLLQNDTLFPLVELIMWIPVLL